MPYFSTHRHSPARVGNTQRLRPQTCPQVRQQPYSSCGRCYHRKPHRGPTRGRHRDKMWAFQYRKDRRRVRFSHVPLWRFPTYLALRYFTFLTECDSPKACTILLRGPSKDILNEIDRNLADAMSVARNAVFNPTLAPGGGATEMAISVGLSTAARTIKGVEGWPFRAVADAMEVIPRTLVQNAGGNAMRVLTELRVRSFTFF
jgi:hypothetical protein